MLLEDRLSLLKQIMFDHDLSSTAKNMCWFLLCECMNEKTGHCYPSDQHIADHLGINRSNVVRAKRQLKTAGVLECKRTPTIGAKMRHFSSYRFNTRFVARKCATSRRTNAPIDRRENASIDRCENAPIVFLETGSPGEVAWRRHYAAIGKTYFPSIREGGASFPAPWPPGHINAEANQ